MSRIAPMTAEQQSQAEEDPTWDGGNADGGTYEDDKSDDNYAWGDDEEEVEVRLTREQLINHISRRRRKFKHLAQLPYTLCMLIVYTVALFAHMDIPTVHDVSQGITDPLLALQFGETPRRTFSDVKSEADFWDWMDEGLLPLLFNLTAAEENEILGVVNGVPVYKSSVRTVPAISTDAVTVISVTAATRTFLGIQSFAEMGYTAGDTVVVEGTTCSSPKSYTVQNVSTTSLTVEEPVYADENTPGDCLISRPAVTDTRPRLPSRKAVVAVQQYNMVVGGLTLKKQKAYELPCKDEDASYLFYLEKGSAAPCYPATHPAASCWDWDNCTYDNLTDTVGPPPGTKSNGDAAEWAQYTVYGDEMIYFDLTEPRPSAAQISAHARNSGWVDRSTMGVTVELPAYNAEQSAYALVQLKVIFNRGGNVQTASFVTMATRPQGTNLGGLAALRWSVVGLMSVIFLDAGFALVNAVHMRKRMEYCTKPATIVDWLIILLAIYIVSEWNFFVFDLKESEDSLMGDEALAVKRQDVVDFSNELVAATARFDRFRALNAVLLLLLLGRVLRPLVIHSRLGFLSTVIQKAMKNLVPFLWIFAPVYFVFATIAHLLFGAYMTDFASISSSVQSLFNMLLGQTDWSALRGPAALYGAGMEFVATAYFWTFYITAFYLLLSVLLAIVLDSYSDMKSQWTASLGVWEEIRSVFMLARARMRGGEPMPHPMVHLGEVEKQLASHGQTVYTKLDLMQELGVSPDEATIIVNDCHEEISRQEEVEVSAGVGGGGGGGGQGSGWSGAVLANHSEGLARILEGVTGLQMEMMETKLRVNNMAARMGINTRTTHVQTHISYQPQNRLKQQQLNADGDLLDKGAPLQIGFGPVTPPDNPYP